MSSIKIYLDGAERSAMVEMASHPLVNGFTTNPSLIRKAGVTDYTAFCKEILNQVQGKPISFEVFADDFEEMKRQALEIESWKDSGKQPGNHNNIYVKIPITNSRGESSIPLIHELSHKGIKLNVTALFTMKQILETCTALKGGAPSIASVFAGRIADAGQDPCPLMQAASAVCRSMDPNIELLWASTREAFNIIQAQQTGCHIITSPLEFIKKMSGFNKDLTQLSLETVQQFKKDSDAAGYRL